MSSSLPWMKFTPQDWIQDTRALSANAKSAWIDLICFMWCRDKEEQGSITNRVDQFARMVGLLPQEMIEVLHEFQDFNICEVTPPVTQDVTQDVTQQRIEDRDKSINTPCSPPVGDAPDLSLSGEESKPQAKRRKKWTRAQLKEEQYEAYPNFQAWWKAYPNRKGIRKAFESWVKQGLEFRDQEPLFKVLSAQKKDPQWVKDDGQYIPMGSTYLNDELYDDPLPEKNKGVKLQTRRYSAG